eukprot:GEMP01011326.1.p2 GENE.GEMP01011326.1~~GEMP01011326.1.p2  ORF type:complete len:130 (+),score=33.30 GEMP01011326.1:245-634(+)
MSSPSTLKVYMLNGASHDVELWKDTTVLDVKREMQWNCGWCVHPTIIVNGTEPDDDVMFSKMHPPITESTLVHYVIARKCHPLFEDREIMVVPKMLIKQKAKLKQCIPAAEGSLPDVDGPAEENTPAEV